MWIVCVVYGIDALFLELERERWRIGGKAVKSGNYGMRVCGVLF
jgi:hypothetical protein